MNFLLKKIRLNKRPDIPCPKESQLTSLAIQAFESGKSFARSIKRQNNLFEINSQARSSRHQLVAAATGHHGVRKLLHGLFLLSAAKQLQRTRRDALWVNYGAMSQRYLMEAYLWLPKEARTTIIRLSKLERFDINRTEYEITWRGVVAAGRVAYGLLRANMAPFYPNPEADVRAKIDMVARFQKNQRPQELAIQIKSTGLAKMDARIMMVEPYASDSNYPVMKAVWKGVGELNQQLNSRYIPVVIFLGLSEAPLEEFEGCPSVISGIRDLYDRL